MTHTKTLTEQAREGLLDMIECWGKHGVQLCTGAMAATAVAAIATVATGEMIEPGFVADDLKRLGMTLGATGLVVSGYGSLSAVVAEKLIAKLETRAATQIHRLEAMGAVQQGAREGALNPASAHASARELVQRFSSEDRRLAAALPRDWQSRKDAFSKVAQTSQAISHSELNCEFAPGHGH